MDQYVRARELFADWCSDIDGAIPIEFGAVGCPGLSDIDIGIVFKNGFNPKECNLKEKLLSFPEHTRKVMNGGTLMFFPEETFKDIMLVDDINANPLSDSLCINDITNEDKELVDLIQIVEWLPERMSRIYIELGRTIVDYKRLVGLYYSLCYSFKKIQKYSGKNERINNFIKQIHSIRDNWFIDEAKSKLAISEIEIFDVFVEAVSVITPVLNIHFNLSVKYDIPIKYNLYGSVNIIASDKYIMVYKDFEDTNVNVPPQFLFTYLEYSKMDSKLGMRISDRVKMGTKNVVVSSAMRDVLQRRFNVLSDLFDFVKDLNCGSGLYKFGWYLNE